MDTNELIQSLKQELKPVSPLRSLQSRWMRWVITAFFCLLAGVASIGVSDNTLEKFQDPVFAFGTLLLVLTSIMASISAFILSVPDLEKSRLHRIWPFITLGLCALCFMIGSAQERDLLGWGMGCVRDSLVLAFAPGAVLFAMIKKAAPLNARLSGLYFALAIGAIGALGTQLTCHSMGPLHLLLWHVGPIALLGCAGIALGRLLVRRSGRETRSITQD